MGCPSYRNSRNISGNMGVTALNWEVLMDFKNFLEWISEAIDGLIILVILLNALNTNCFQPLDGGLIITALSFSLFVKIVVSVTS